MVATLTPTKNGAAAPQNQKLGPCRLSPHDPRLFVDPDYQRDLEPATQRKIQKAGWSEAKAGYILLNLRPSGALAIIDGSNRVGGAKSLDVKSINAQVIQITVKDEAELYVAVNRDRKANTQLQLWKALSNYDKTVQEMNAVLAKHGFKVQAIGNGHNINHLTCPYAVHWIFQRGGLTLLEATLETVKMAWPNNRDARGSTILQGLAHFISTWEGQFSAARLVSVLQKTSVVELVTNSKDRRRSFRWSPYFAISFGVTEAYNRKLTERNKLDVAHYHGLGGDA